MSAGLPVARHTHAAGHLDETLTFLKRTRSELRELRKVQVYRDCLRIFDVNGDRFEVAGLGYPHSEIVPVLYAVNAAFNPDLIHAETALEYKEFKTGRRHAWASDRVL